MTEKPKTLYIAMTETFPGYWGESTDTEHHAIASACDAGASRGSLFRVYEAYEGCYVNEMGGLTWLKDHGKPEIIGYYDAAGNHLGSTVAEAADNARQDAFYLDGVCALSRSVLKALKEHKE